MSDGYQDLSGSRHDGVSVSFSRHHVHNVERHIPVSVLIFAGTPSMELFQALGR